MNQFGNLNSQYYDLLLSDKNYKAEVDYVNNLIESNLESKNSSTKSLLDLGCGTGKHAELLSDKGYLVHGIDLSAKMLKIAENRRVGKEDKLTFNQSNIKDLNLNKKFDVVVSLFHVMSYQNSNAELIKAFKVAKKHLKKGGVFIFDFWYGPAVLTDLPTIRVKRLENNNIKVTRISEPTLHPRKNIVNVNYDLFIKNKGNENIYQTQELHSMRFFFDTELEIVCKEMEFNIKEKYTWMGKNCPDFSSWSVVWVLINLNE